MVTEYTRLDAWLSFRIEANSGVNPVVVEVPDVEPRNKFRCMLKRHGFTYKCKRNKTEILTNQQTDETNKI